MLYLSLNSSPCTNVGTTGNITVTGSTQAAIDTYTHTEGYGVIYVKILNQKTGVAAGTYTLATLLQNLVNISHSHEIYTRTDCDCSGDSDCDSDSDNFVDWEHI